MANEDRARWTRLVADFEWCDLSQREFVEERGISLSNLRYWLYRLRFPVGIDPAYLRALAAAL